MKKLALVLLGALLIGLSLFTGCKKAAGPSADGLTTIKVFGLNQEIAHEGATTKLSQWYDGSVKSRLWDQFEADLAKLGIKLELDLIMTDQIATTFQTMLATGKLNDYDWLFIPNVDDKTLLSMVDQGRLYPLNKAIDQYSQGPAKEFYNNGYGKTYANLTRVADGNFYWLTVTTATYYKAPPNFQGSSVSGNIRKDWLDAVGLGIPKTLDEFYNALSTFQQQDMNRNGVKDEVASINMSNFGNGVAQWFGLGTDIISSLDNKVVSPWYQAHAKDYFAYMNKLYKAGLIQISDDGTNQAANKIAYNYDYSIATWAEQAIQVPNGAAKPYLAPFALQAAADTPPRVWQEAGLGALWSRSFIPAGSKHVDAVARFIDYMVSDECKILSRVGIEGYTFEYDSDHNPQFITNPNIVGRDDVIRAHEHTLWISAIFPRFQEVERHVEAIRLANLGKDLGYPETGFSLKSDFQEAVYNGLYASVQDIDGIVAFPTAQEIDRLAEIRPDLTTYSEELVTSLIIGDKSLSNWDSYMADLKRLGLDELISIYQARIDRAK